MRFQAASDADAVDETSTDETIQEAENEAVFDGEVTLTKIADNRHQRDDRGVEGATRDAAEGERAGLDEVKGRGLAKKHYFRFRHNSNIRNEFSSMTRPLMDGGCI